MILLIDHIQNILEKPENVLGKLQLGIWNKKIFSAMLVVFRKIENMIIYFRYIIT